MTRADIRYLNWSAFCLLGGMHVLVISVFADELAFGDVERFGWQQYAGMVLAAILMLTGVIIRTPVILGFGLAIGVFTALADWLAFGSATGFGWQQISGTCLGAFLIGCGWWFYRKRFRSPDRSYRAEGGRPMDQA